MLLPSVFNVMNAVSKEQLITELLEMNNESREFGLVLTPRESIQILEERNRSLQQLGRIELGINVSKSIIHSFCNSPFITQDEYVHTLNELHEIFYYMKNETEDKIGDEELIKIMRNYFEDICGGSLEMLKGTLTSFAVEFRKKAGMSELIKKEGENGFLK